MGNEIIKFANEEFGEIRTIQEQDTVLFCGSDVAKALGYSNTKDALSRHCRKDGVAFRDLIDGMGRTQQAKFITEGNVYRLIAHSRLPSAERFERWVFDEVLPSIRKHGAYMTTETIERTLTDPDFIISLATELKAERQARIEAEQKLEDQKPLVDFVQHIACAEESVSMGELAKIASKNGVSIGRNKLFGFLRDNSVLAKDNLPYQSYMNRGWFEVKESCYQDGRGVHIKATTLVKPKGQIGVINMLLSSVRNHEENNEDYYGHLALSI